MATVPDQSEKWHVRKEVQLSHIITTLAIAIGAASYITTMDKRIALVEREVGVLHENDEAQKAVNGDAVLQVRSQLDRINAKLDRILEGRGQR
jgi:hypothetical protein